MTAAILLLLSKTSVMSIRYSKVKVNVFASFYFRFSQRSVRREALREKLM